MLISPTTRPGTPIRVATRRLAAGTLLHDCDRKRDCDLTEKVDRLAYRVEEVGLPALPEQQVFVERAERPFGMANLDLEHP